jgi:hypothetical protein
MYIYSTTGPLCLTNSVNKWLEEHPDSIEILTPSYFESCSVDLHCDPDPQAFGLHVFEGSWVKGSDRMFLNLYIYRKTILWIIFGIIAVIGSYFAYRYYKRKRVIVDGTDLLQLDPLPSEPDAINELFPAELMDKLIEPSIPSTPMSTVSTISANNPLDSIVKQVVHQFEKELKK